MLSKTAYREAKEGFDKTMAGILDNFRKAADAMLKAILTSEGILRCLLPAAAWFEVEVSDCEIIAYKWHVLESEMGEVSRRLYLKSLDALERVMPGLVYIKPGYTYPWGNPIPRELAEIGKLRTAQAEGPAVKGEAKQEKVYQFCTLDELAIVGENLPKLIEVIWDKLPERPDSIKACMEDLESVNRRSWLPVPDSLLS